MTSILDSLPAPADTAGLPPAVPRPRRSPGLSVADIALRTSRVPLAPQPAPSGHSGRIRFVLATAARLFLSWVAIDRKSVV